MPQLPKKNCMTPLNLPPRRLPLTRRPDGAWEVFDPLRRRKIMLTPEEWVRQHFVTHLVLDLGYPPSLMANEVAVNLNGLSRRCDTVVWNPRDGSPLLVVEYKAPTVEITDKVFAQIARYNMVLRAPYLIVSNGLRHYCCRLNTEATAYELLPTLLEFKNLVN